MSRESIHREMTEILGRVPGFFGSLPDDTLEAEWSLFKRFELEETAIPAKYRELIGVAVAASQRCWYCTNFHSAMAMFNGATQAEVQEASHLAKFGSGWSAYLNGQNYDREEFIRELHSIGEFLSSRS